MRKRRIEESHIAINHHDLEGEAIQAGWSQLPLQSFIKRDDTVVITPNWVKDESPDTGTIVGPGSLLAIVRLVQGYQPKRIVVASGSGGAQTEAVMENQGFGDMLKGEAEFIDLNFGPYTELELSNCIPESTPVNQLLEEMDVHISYGQIKVHQEATVTLGIKNVALGWPPAEKHGWPKTERGIHTNLHPFIAAMGRAVPIDLTILSGTHAMIGTGPAGGKPVRSGLVIMGTDPVATDVTGARMLGFMPPAVQYLWQLIQDGVGQGDLTKVQFHGLDLAEAERIFSQAAYQHSIVLDKTTQSLHV